MKRVITFSSIAGAVAVALFVSVELIAAAGRSLVVDRWPHASEPAGRNHTGCTFGPAHPVGRRENLPALLGSGNRSGKQLINPLTIA